jgi:hypothetical protein
VHTELAGMYYERAQMGIALGGIDMPAGRSIMRLPITCGLIHMELREYKEADEDFQQSLRLDKTDPRQITIMVGSCASAAGKESIRISGGIEESLV